MPAPQPPPPTDHATFAPGEAKLLAAQLTVALNDASHEKLAAIALQIRQSQPFLYAMLGDTLQAALNQRADSRSISQYSEVVAARLKSLGNWHPETNETVAAIQQGKIAADAIKPHVRLEPAAYDGFYAAQSEKIGLAAARSGKAREERNHTELALGPNINHAFRRTHAVSLIETVLGIAGNVSAVGEPIRWMDIGCGVGEFANSVNPRRFGTENWEIVGCDLQDGKIAFANLRKTKGRTFFSSDAFQMLDNYKKRGESFHLVSMFEFLEHLDDPLRFVRQLDMFNPEFIIAASPLEQQLHKPMNAEPDRVHLWSFSRKSWEQMFEIAGFEPVYSSEIRVGSYLGGLDWLTVVCGPREQMRARRGSLAAGRDPAG